MKIGICLLLLANESDPLAKQYIPLIADAGYDYAEVSLARIYHLSDDDIADYCRLFSQHNIKVESFNNAVPAGFSVIGNDATEEVQNAYIERSIMLAKQFGVSVITTSGPNAGRVPEGFDWPGVGYTRYIDFLKRFADACSDDNISIALEPICKAERGYVNTFDQALSIIKHVDMPNLSLLVDVYHSSLEREDFSRLASYTHSGVLTHLHVANLENRTIPTLQDTEELCSLLEPLKAAHFNGRISIEAKPTVNTTAAISISEGVKAIRKVFEL